MADSDSDTAVKSVSSMEQTKFVAVAVLKINKQIIYSIFGKWEMIKRFFRFLKDPAYLVIEIRKTNNYEIKNSQWFDKDGNLIDDASGILEKNGTIDENGNLITKNYGTLTKKL